MKEKLKEKLDLRIQHGKLDIDETRVPMGLSWTHVYDGQNHHAVYCYREKLPGYVLALADKEKLPYLMNRPAYQIQQFVYKNTIVIFAVFWFTLCEYETCLSWREECRRSLIAWKRSFREKYGIGPHNYHTFNRLS